MWRGSRDGFSPRDFHQRCDGHGHTLTVIQDTDGNVFGGFTPIKWESRVWNQQMWEKNNCPKGDSSRRTFLFTILNPFGVPPRRFVLREGWEKYAIYCDGAQGPVFGVEADITVRPECNEKPVSYTRYFGNTFINDTRLGGPPKESTFFTGAHTFIVREIEVFQITGGQATSRIAGK